MRYAIINKKYGTPIGTAHTALDCLAVCGIEVVCDEVDTENPEYPRNLVVTARKRYTVGLWFKQSYILKDKRSYISELRGLTKDGAIKRATQNLIRELKKEFLIVPVTE